MTDTTLHYDGQPSNGPVLELSNDDLEELVWNLNRHHVQQRKTEAYMSHAGRAALNHLTKNELHAMGRIVEDTHNDTALYGVIEKEVSHAHVRALPTDAVVIDAWTPEAIYETDTISEMSRYLDAPIVVVPDDAGDDMCPCVDGRGDAEEPVGQCSVALSGVRQMMLPLSPTMVLKRKVRQADYLRLIGNLSEGEGARLMTAIDGRNGKALAKLCDHLRWNGMDDEERERLVEQAHRDADLVGEIGGCCTVLSDRISDRAEHIREFGVPNVRPRAERSRSHPEPSGHGR